MPRIALDALGGDHIREACPEAVRSFLALHREEELFLAADPPLHEAVLAALEPADRERVLPLEADGAVDFAEAPVKAVRSRPGVSIRAAVEAVRDGRAAAAVSFGHTGAAVAAAGLYLGLADGVERPALAAVVPSGRGGTMLLDVGAGLDPRPEHLLGFALLGRAYCRARLGRPEPSVGLLNIGTEEGKGGEDLCRAWALLRDRCPGFLGNVEGHHVFDGPADVVVCSGMTGNMILKACEGQGAVLFRALREALGGGEALDGVFARHDPDARGACRLLGVRGCVLVGHGRARAPAIAAALAAALDELRLYPPDAA